MGFQNKVVIVTGAGVGIGRAAAVLFAQKGAKVVVNSITPANGEETLRQVRQAGSEGIYVRADVSKPEDCKRIVDKAMAAFGRVDVLVNNAGIVLRGTIDDTTLADFDRTMDVNVKGTLLMCQLVVPIMRSQGGGSIVNTASVLATKGAKDRIAYSASKGAVLSLSRAMAAELIRENIRVNCVSPGSTYTPSLEARINASPDPAAALRDFQARQPMGRLGEASEIAQAILFAADEEAGFLNGHDLVIDGGSRI